jgi:hypothetical protein
VPYIDPRRRLALTDPKGLRHPVTPGELNFAVTKLLCNYIQWCGESYGAFNAVIGVLECAKLELYRRKIAQHEDRKCAENGDVY